MFSLESDIITAVWPNDSLTFTLYATFSNSIPKWATFVKEVFDLMFSLESDKWLLSVKIGQYLKTSDLQKLKYPIISNNKWYHPTIPENFPKYPTMFDNI